VKSDHGVDIREEIAFISSHFYEFKSSELKELGLETLEDILSRNSLRLESEDCLFETLREVGFEGLFRYIECCFLSSEAIERYLCAIRVEGFVFDSVVWQSLCRRLVVAVSIEDSEFCRNRFVEKRKPTPPPKAEPPSEAFLFSGSAFSGILSHLSGKCGGNVHERGIVNITSSSDGSNKPWEVTNHGCDSYWLSLNAANSWICFDFKENSICLKNYTLKTDRWCLTQIHLREWVIEGSNDNSTWTVLDKQNTEDLNGPSLVKTFGCSSESSQFFRFVRLRQTGRNCCGNDHLLLTNIELFGSLQTHSA
jgi:hypothetical protein